MPCSSSGARTEGAEGLRDRLMAQADAEDRGARLGGGAHHRHGDAGAGRACRARGEQHPGDSEVGEFVDVDGVVAPHDAPDAQLPEVLDQVVDEAVEVVDDEDRAVRLLDIVRSGFTVISEGARGGAPRGSAPRSRTPGREGHRIRAA